MLDGIAIADVERKRMNCDAGEIVFELPFQLQNAVQPPGTNEKADIMAGKCSGSGFSDAARGPGDEHNSIFDHTSKLRLKRRFQ
jgi:hypothetical protein